MEDVHADAPVSALVHEADTVVIHALAQNLVSNIDADEGVALRVSALLC